MIILSIQTALNDFLNRFIGRPEADFSEVWPLEMIIRAESTHFLFSCLAGWLAFSLILTILSSSKRKWSDPYIFRFSLLFGLAASVTMHILIDGFTNLA